MSPGARGGPPYVPVTVHPLVLSPDVERLHAFYAGLLGAEISQRFPAEGEVFSLELRVDGFRLGLVQVGDVVAGEPGRVLLSIDVDDVDVLLPRVTELGGRVTGGPTDMPWGQRVLHVRDPDGNAVNLNAPV
jgi:predicted enzyme related to lactoylglutathione lyase